MSGHRGRGAGARILGVTGELLVTLGVLGLLFVVWEIWWTGLDAERSAQATEDEFQTLLEQPDTDLEPRQQAEAQLDCQQLANGEFAACPEKMAAVESGAMAVVYAPAIGTDWSAPVLSGVDDETLNTGGLGHYPDTQLPGEPGNFAVAGHRLTYGDVLRDQDQLAAGDKIYVESLDGYYTYEVSESYVVLPEQSEVILPVPGEPEAQADRSLLTLTTCHPLFSNRERLITHAELVDWSPLSAEAPAAVVQGGS
ncbi:class E sortase [Nesterenkonia sp. E16_7]|uniref:class E sortase n=1 Tax=unclassified Nesterenkonia TaxID=2629769 RepID=UPI001A9131EB|nr:MULTISPECIES: class E sortase [unclassified Nesterenkonia]MBO0596973.1 class E sortase [Nesterenkonia sp. E16_10]MBO0598389.1 class E sortase [Nesterenkonia sp. E16_7]